MSAAGVASKNFRPEIQALRALAVAIVVLNHLWPGRLPGGFIGVDVFFVISGYLITAHLMREAGRSGKVRLGAFWARRARRLLPASMLVLVVCAVAVVTIVPMAQWELALGQIAAAAIYGVNWLLMAQATDYFTSANSPSPVTHFWSLSVEEQFYLVWPLLIVTAFLLARGSRRRGAMLTSVILGGVFVASLVYSIAISGSQPSVAYFSTLTRAWEFAAGGLLALALAKAQLPARASVWASWLGWSGLALSTVIILPETVFPGWIALVPVVSTLLVIAARSGTGGPNLNDASGFAPVQFIGDISYSLYLWHWPLIILTPFVLGRELGDLSRIAVLVLSVVLAWASKRWIEDPVRSSYVLTSRRSWVTLTATVTAMAVVAAVALVPASRVGVIRQDVSDQMSALAFEADPCFGALAAENDCADSHELRYPDAVVMDFSANGGTVPGYAPECVTPEAAPLVTACTYGPPADGATRTVALMGDSHAAHYTSALAKLAVTEGWRVVSVAQSGCMPVGFDDRLVALWAPEKASDCRAWAEQAIGYLAQRSDIDTVVYSSISREYGYVDGTPTDQQDISESYMRSWQPWVDAGKRVLVLADTAFLNRGGILECLAKQEGVADPCASPRDTVLAKPDPMIVAAERMAPGAVGVFDPNDFICDSDLCHAVVGGIPVFVDHNHLLQAFAMTLAGPISAAMRALEGES
ncbi:acyltransferase family protein [Microbacterium sp. NPDC006705]|uniref:acyltransferase family protein n=1 Tax=Microbacterium sp. NPDC006705 TaxID=3364181 RepID=UPI003850096D